jgi:anti-sigma regulatory factor (Ser/Thr protein kinase)
VTIQAIATEHSLKFVITDEGKAFDPTQHGDVDTTLSAEDRPIGGLGIMLVQQLMDSINYEYINNKNVLTLKKIINK